MPVCIYAGIVQEKSEGASEETPSHEMRYAEQQALSHKSVPLFDRAFDFVHVDRGKLVFECLLGTFEVFVQGSVDVPADRAERRRVLVEVEERVGLGLVDSLPEVEERDVLERTYKVYILASFLFCEKPFCSVTRAFTLRFKRRLEMP